MSLSLETYVLVQQSIKKYMDSHGGGGTAVIPVATKKILGGVKASDEVSVDKNGALSIVAIPISKVKGLEDKLAAIEKLPVGEFGELAAADADKAQFEISDRVLKLKKVDASLVDMGDVSLADKLSEIERTVTWDDIDS